MYQLTKTINDELVFTSRESQNIKVLEHFLKALATQESFIGVTDKSGQLVDITEKRVIWSPGDRMVTYKNEKQRIVIKIKII